jgi:hypothetical protein
MSSRERARMISPWDATAGRRIHLRTLLMENAMTTRNRSFLPALAFSAAIAAGSMAAHAQTSPGAAAQGGHDAHRPGAGGQGTAPASSPHGGMMPMMQHGGPGMMGGMPFEHVEGRLAFLKAELKITPAQEPQWNKFADAFRSVAKSAQGMHQQMMGSSGTATAPQRLDAYEKMLTVRLDAVRTVRSAFDPLYAALSDEQKKTADELVGNRMGLL